MVKRSECAREAGCGRQDGVASLSCRPEKPRHQTETPPSHQEKSLDEGSCEDGGHRKSRREATSPKGPLVKALPQPVAVTFRLTPISLLQEEVAIDRFQTLDTSNIAW